MFNGIKNIISDFYFKKVVPPKRVISTSNIESAKSIGIVYIANDEEVSELVKKYIKHLRQHSIKINTLGFYKEKELHRDLMPKLEYSYFCNKDLNFGLVPSNPDSVNFINNEFDILIDTCVKEDKSIRFVITQSKAKFKVGYAGLSYADNFDFSIQLKDQKNVRELMKNIDRYLHLINK